MAVPLSQTLGQLTREARVRRRWSRRRRCSNLLGRSSILNRQMVFGDRRTEVYLRLATSEWFDEDARAEFEGVASRLARETVALILQQLPATGGEPTDLSALLPREQRVPPDTPGSEPRQMPELLAATRARLHPVIQALPLPDETVIVETTLLAVESGRTTVEVAYLAPFPLPTEARQVLGRSLVQAAGDPGLQVDLVHLAAPSLPLDPLVPDTLRFREIGALLRRYPRLRLELFHPEPADSVDLRHALDLLHRLGLEPHGVATHPGSQFLLRLRSEPPAESS